LNDRAGAGGSRYVLAVLLAVNALNFYDRQVLGAVAEPVRKELGLSDAALGALTTAFTLLYAVVGVPLGRLADRVSRTRLLAAGVFVWSLLTAASGLARSFGQLFALRLGVGLGEASCAPAATSLIGDLVPAARRGLFLALFMMGLPIGTALSYLVSGAVGQAWGWRSAFYIAGIPGLLCAAAVLFIDEPARGASEVATGAAAATAGSPYRRVLSIPTMWWIIASGALHNFVMYAVSAFFVPYLMRFHRMDLRGAADLSTLAFGLAGMLGLVLGGVAADEARRWPRGRLLLAAGGAALSAPLLWLALGQSSGRTAAFGELTGLAFVALYVYYAATYAAIQDVVGPALRGTAMALYFLAMYVLGASFGPLLTGMASDHFTAAAAREAGAALAGSLEPYRGEGLRRAMQLLPGLTVALAGVLWAGSRAVERDMVSRP
jgi:predicted MFS family arabinose efflux permease